MAANGNQPVSAANLAAALGVSASGSIGSQPISVDNLKAALAASAGSGAADILFQSQSGATSGTLSRPVEDYDLVMAIVGEQGSGTKRYAAIAPPSAWNICGNLANPYVYTLTPALVNEGVYGHAGTSGKDQPTDALFLNMTGTYMGYRSYQIHLPVFLVVGIKNTGFNFG